MIAIIIFITVNSVFIDYCSIDFLLFPYFIFLIFYNIHIIFMIKLFKNILSTSKIFFLVPRCCHPNIRGVDKSLSFPFAAQTHIVIHQLSEDCLL